MTDEEKQLSDYIEQCVGGKVVSIKRQARWRKAWYATVEKNGQPIPLFVRGDKQLDAEPFPGLQREAGILQTLESQGLPVPHVYGFCESPQAIIMDQVPGERDVSFAADDQERHKLACDYMDVLAKMHSLELKPFVDMGVDVPQTPEDIALSYINANQPLYERTKLGVDPLVEFGLQWLRRNVPQHRSRASFIHCDAGQYLFDQGKLTCIYDFEASHIGDPLADLASLRGRQPTEPFGTDLSSMLQHYQQVTGEPIDQWALSYHTAAFMMTAVMALVGPLKDPKVALHAEYLVWDLTCRRAFLWAMAECLGISIERCSAVERPAGHQQLTLRVLQQSLERINPSDDAGLANKNSALMLVEWLKKADQQGAQVVDRELAMVADILGYQPDNLEEADVALEDYVLTAGPEQDEKLFRYFAWKIEQQCLVAESVGERLEGYALKPIVL